MHGQRLQTQMTGSAMRDTQQPATLWQERNGGQVEGNSP